MQINVSILSLRLSGFCCRFCTHVSLSTFNLIDYNRIFGFIVTLTSRFHPPDPLYEIISNGDDYKVNISPELPTPPDFPGVIKVDMALTLSNSKIPIICFIIKEAKYTMIYSHGNATDCGAMYSRYLNIATALSINVIGYDYTGYGASPGIPTEKQTYKDIECVYKWAIDNGELHHVNYIM